MTDNTKSLLASLTVEEGVIINCNEVFTELFGFTLSEIENLCIEDKLRLDEQSVYSNLNDLFVSSITAEGGIFASAAFFNNLHYAVSVKLHCIYEKHQTFKIYFLILCDKSKDPISGLPNGWALTSRVDFLINNRNFLLKNMTLIVVEADNFSSINFRYNYIVGDQFLVKLGDRLKDIMSGSGFVVRFSNAKFAILLEDHDELSLPSLNLYIKKICERLCLSLSIPISISEKIEISKSFSIGVSSPGFAYDCYHSMQIAAETEKQKAQKYSTNKYYIAPVKAKGDFLTQKLIIDALPQAIASNQIQVHYQPQYNLNDNTLVGLEALSRWHDPILGHIPPNIFVAIAEDIGLHFEFDLWVFENVCLQLIEWQKQNILIPRVAINMSLKTMEKSSFVERIIVILKDTECPTHLIELEVTETGSINNSDMLKNNMLEVKKLGMHIAVDDFGTGYSSLSMIRNFYLSLDKLKLDRSLIDKVCLSELDKNFTKQIIELGKLLKLSVLAEGVETKQQLDLLTELGCDSAQGYYFSKALSSIDIIKLMQSK